MAEKRKKRPTKKPRKKRPKEDPQMRRMKDLTRRIMAVPKEEAQSGQIVDPDHCSNRTGL